VVNIDPALLTPTNMTAANYKYRDLNAKYTMAIAARRRMQAAINQATKAVGSARAMEVYGSRYRSALAAETAAQKASATQKTYYGDFGKNYNRFMGLAKANPNADTALSKLTPYDPQSAADRLAAQQALNQRLLQVQTGRQQLGEDYQKNARLMEQDQPDRYRALLSGYAGRGLAYSSGYANALGNETADFTQRRADLDTANQRGQGAAAMDEASAQSTFQGQLAAILSNATARLADNAGGLGMAGNTDLPLLLEIARRRLAASAGG